MGVPPVLPCACPLMVFLASLNEFVLEYDFIYV